MITTKSWHEFDRKSMINCEDEIMWRWRTAKQTHEKLSKQQCRKLNLLHKEQINNDKFLLILLPFYWNFVIKCRKKKLRCYFYYFDILLFNHFRFSLQRVILTYKTIIRTLFGKEEKTERRQYHGKYFSGNENQSNNELIYLHQLDGKKMYAFFIFHLI